MRTDLLQAVAAGPQITYPQSREYAPRQPCMHEPVGPDGNLDASLVAGLGFTCMERLLTLGPAGKYLESLFRSNKSLPANQVRPAVLQAATNLVGMLHVFIVVSLQRFHSCICFKLQTSLSKCSCSYAVFLPTEANMFCPDGCVTSQAAYLLIFHRITFAILTGSKFGYLLGNAAMLQVPLAIATLEDPRMIKGRLYSTSSTSNTMLAIASGYFVHDLVICTLQLSTWGPAYLLHALFCSLLYCYGLFSGVLHFYGRPAYLSTQQAHVALH